MACIRAQVGTHFDPHLADVALQSLDAYGGALTGDPGVEGLQRLPPPRSKRRGGAPGWARRASGLTASRIAPALSLGRSSGRGPRSRLTRGRTTRVTVSGRHGTEAPGDPSLPGEVRRGKAGTDRALPLS
jgi:hypothetical protein